MVKHLVVTHELHTQLKIAATNRGTSVKAHLEHLLDSQKRLAMLASDLENMSKEDVYRLVTADKVILLKAEEVLFFDN